MAFGFGVNKQANTRPTAKSSFGFGVNKAQEKEEKNGAVVAKELSDFLGGGAYKMKPGDPSANIKTERSNYGGLPTAKGYERADIFPVSLAGVNSNPKNITMEENIPGFDKASERQKRLPEEKTIAYKEKNNIPLSDRDLKDKENLRFRTKTDKYLMEEVLPKYKSGEISLREAQVLATSFLRNEQEGLDFTTSGQLKKMGKNILDGFSNVLKSAEKKIVEKAKNITPEDVSRSVFKSAPYIATGGLDIYGATSALARKSEIVEPLVQAPPRAVTSVLLQPVADAMGVRAEYKPTTKLEKFFFGEEPITGIFTRTEKSSNKINDTLNKMGVNPDLAKGMSLALAPLFVGGTTAMDLSPVGGEKKAAEKVAASKSIDDIVRLIKPLFKGRTDDEIRIIAEPLVDIKDAGKVKEYIRNQSDNIVNGIIKDYEQTRTLQGKVVPQAEKAAESVPAVKTETFGFGVNAEKTKVSKPKTTIQYVPDEVPADGRRKLKYEPLIGQSKLGKGVEAKAIKNKLTKGFEGLPDYDKVNIEDQATKVKGMIDTDPDFALDVALGRKEAPAGVLPESAFIAVEEQAIKDGNVDVLRRLATESSLVQESSIMGQRLRMLAERNEYSPVKNINKVLSGRKAYVEGLKKNKGIKIAVLEKKETSALKKEIEKAHAKVDEWQAFISEITCKV